MYIPAPVFDVEKQLDLYAIIDVWSFAKTDSFSLCLVASHRLMAWLSCMIQCWCNFLSDQTCIDIWLYVDTCNFSECCDLPLDISSFYAREVQLVTKYACFTYWNISMMCTTMVWLWIEGLAWNFILWLDNPIQTLFIISLQTVYALLMYCFYVSTCFTLLWSKQQYDVFKWYVPYEYHMSL